MDGGVGGSGEGLSPHHVSTCAGSTLFPKLLFVAPCAPQLLETLKGSSGGCGLLHHLPSAGGAHPPEPALATTPPQSRGWEAGSSLALLSVQQLHGCKALLGPFPNLLPLPKAGRHPTTARELLGASTAWGSGCDVPRNAHAVPPPAAQSVHHTWPHPVLW